MTKPIIVIKYGGNAMTNEVLKQEVLTRIFALKDAGSDVVLVHGGGPFIQKVLDDSGIETEFIGGHRKTPADAMPYVEMALKGMVNGSIVGIANKLGYAAAGLSGKDGRLATAVKRTHIDMVDGKPREVDLGQVGDVKSVDVTLIKLLLEQNCIPVITCIVPGEDGEDYNVNADMFAGEIAGALQADEYIVLTDVDGLRQDKDDPSTLIQEMHIDDIDDLVEQKVIQGGMIPKIEACRIAVNKGAKTARIMNGTKPEYISDLQNKNKGTVIRK